MDSLRSDMATEPKLQKKFDCSTEHEIKLRYAILLSLILHILGYWVIPNIQYTPLPEPIRFEIEIASQAGQQAIAKSPNNEQEKIDEQKAPAVEKKVVIPPKKVAIEKPKPVLTTQSHEAPNQTLVETLTEPAPTLVTESNAPTSEITETSAAAGAPVPNAKASSNQAETSINGSNKATNEVSEAEVWGEYGQKLYTMVGKNKRYPPIAVRRHWEGDVSVIARFISGVLVEVKLLRSSGRNVLDDESMRMVKEAIEQTPLTGNLVGKDFSVTIPVNFELY